MTTAPDNDLHTSGLFLTLGLILMMLSACAPEPALPGAPPTAVRNSTQIGDGSGSTDASSKLNLQFTTEGQNQTEGFITPDGGSLETMDSRGNTYLLEIPPGALLNSVVIQLTPVQEAANLPFTNGLSAAVQIQPQGLDLVVPAVLTITSPEGFNLEESISFGYSEEDNDLYLLPARKLGSSFSTLLSHFSVDGIGSGTAEDREALAPDLTEITENDCSGAAAAVLQDSYTPEGDLEPSQAAVDEISDMLQEWWMSDILPDLENSAESGSIEDFIAAANDYFSWQKQVHLMEDYLGLAPEEGYFSQQQDQGWNLIQNVFETIQERTIAACVEKHDLRALNTLLRLERLADLLGLPPINTSEVLMVLFQ